MRRSLTLATRTSPLAMAQTQLVKQALEVHDPAIEIIIHPVTSQADWKKEDGEKPLAEEQGGKGLFAKEIEQLILSKHVDAGVHSMKDMATDLPAGLTIRHVLRRADARDCLISKKAKRIEDLPDNAVIGTCSPRRAAMILAIRPDIRLVPFRGNVETRLQKIRDGQVDGTFLALAGLERLGIYDPDWMTPLSSEVILPACGQGIVCIETREEDVELHNIFSAIHCPVTGLCAMAERAVLSILDGSCHTPIGSYAVINQKSGMMTLTAMILSPDGTDQWREQQTAPCSTEAQADALGQAVAKVLLHKSRS